MKAAGLKPTEEVLTTATAYTSRTLHDLFKLENPDTSEERKTEEVDSEAVQKGKGGRKSTKPKLKAEKK